MRLRMLSFTFIAVLTLSLAAVSFAQEPPKPEPKPKPAQEPAKQEPAKQEPAKQEPLPAPAPIMREAKAAPMPTMNLIETTKAGANFTTLAKAIEAAGLTETLNGAGPFTIFAPTDEAFAKLPAETLDALMKDKEALKSLLLHHVISGKVSAKEVAAMESAKVLEGPALTIQTSGDKVTIDNVKIVQPDIAASNGVIHAIDTVLVIPKK